MGPIISIRHKLTTIIIIWMVMLDAYHTQTTQLILVQDCRITRFQNSGQFFRCEKQTQCLDDPPPSSMQLCSRYNYAEITVSQCYIDCCPDLVADVAFTAAQVQQCLDNWKQQQISYVLIIVLSIIGVVAILVIIGLIFINGFMKNPYTGKRIWIGCCCCAKKIDFSKQRGQLQSDDRLTRGKMEQQKKINLQEFVQQLK